jgi:dimeric dUTPase (all-alpha-NTP-PPase superfamily)
MSNAITDRLETIFTLQAELNDHVFASNDLRDNAGQLLSMAAIREEVTKEKLGVNDLPNEWLTNYALAMKDELRELEECLNWKWWSKDVLNLQNVRVELIDLLHFLVSAMICAGLNADRVADIYRQKHTVNLARQRAGYSQSTKTEEDNQGIR